jgi:hypothetical protein
MSFPVSRTYSYVSQTQLKEINVNPSQTDYRLLKILSKYQIPYRPLLGIVLALDFLYKEFPI